MSEKRLDIQGLRGWAIILVVLFHFFPSYCPNGYIGVDMFFVISGFLMAMILGKVEKLNTKSFCVFYYRRVKRILPLYYLAIGAILIALLSFLPLTYRSSNIESARKAIIFISNVKKADPNLEYKRMLENAGDLFTHTWSLCVELQWYLLLPLLYFVQRSTIWEGTFFVGNKPSWETALPYVSFCIFSLAIVVPFVPAKIPEDALRTYVTGFSAILIIVGGKHQNVLLSNQAIVYVGDISYALYLFHWPIYVIAKFFTPHMPFALVLGLLGSVVLAVAVHHCFEKFYLRWSPIVILILITALSASCALLALQPHNVYDGNFKLEPVDYRKINPNDAAWNMTLMRYLNFMEGERDNFELERVGCIYRSRFTFTQKYKPLGFFSMEKGPGSYDFLVIGNSFACNQAEMVLKAFRKYIRRFNELCLYACEIMAQTRYPLCRTRFNHTAVIEELKPDVVFVIERSIDLKNSFNTRDPIDHDKIFKDLVERITKLEQMTKKVYIVQAIPSCIVGNMRLVHEFTKKGRPLKEIQEGLLWKDDFFARLRIQELGKRCRNCELIDYLPMLVDEHGHYLGYNPKNNLVFIDSANHLTRFAKERVQPLFDRLAKSFETTVAFDNVTLS